MGVSLERVQFKFASIIGELCSEPVVLSQFAIWLDLRLAEYKSKGAISLDCSGEKPDPSWLKGMRADTPPTTAKRVLGSRVVPRSSSGFNRGGIYSRSSAFHRRGVNSNSSRLSHPQSQSQRLGQSDMSERLSSDSGDRSHSQGSDDVVLIKDEPSADSSVYPISLHAHQIGESSERKRSATESASGDAQNDSASPYKVRKSPTEDSSLNQSLMSVLGTSIDDNDQNPDHSLPTGTNESSTPATDMDYSISLQDQTADSSSFQAWADNSVANTSSTSTFTPSRPSTSSAAGNCAAGDNQSPDADQSTQNDDEGTIVVNVDDAFLEAAASGSAPKPPSSAQKPTTSAQKPTTTSSTDERLKVESPRTIDYPTVAVGTGHLVTISPAEQARKDEVSRSLEGSVAKSTSNYIAGCVVAFERWLSMSVYKDMRKIEEIGPSELDEYLALYFKEVKKLSGGDYTLDSFRLLRSKLDNYLRRMNYPCSLKSDVFIKSKIAFNERVMELMSGMPMPL